MCDMNVCHSVGACFDSLRMFFQTKQKSTLSVGVFISLREEAREHRAGMTMWDWRELTGCSRAGLALAKC